MHTQDNNHILKLITQTNVIDNLIAPSHEVVVIEAILVDY